MHGIYITFEETENIQSIVRTLEIALSNNGFTRVSGNFYACEKDGLRNTFIFMEWLKKESDLTNRIKSIHAFHLDDLSDFSDVIKE
ncbi:hypothetical protein [Parabacteroides sp. PF5-9]|uniref:hypothetical protein n=1 Tax=Parabacteroides sp. PF5-9 TaxID=1742404 RepID=UPI0024753DC5|nr:hypothetical protein [Parabacteroides sp. PF5-9]MDH6357136.1 virulence-associated protein VapD [Parabacteroides sp. PF5-9]